MAAAQQKFPGLSFKFLDNLRKDFAKDKKNILALNVAVKTDPTEVLLNRSVVERSSHVYNHKVDEVKPITDQKSSGRCWIFALLNVIRQHCSSVFCVDDLEFSQTYLFFWDKIERANYFLHTFAELGEKGEDIDGRLMMYLLRNPMNDGGQWDMLVNLVEKYGLMPKSVHSDAFSSTNSSKMNFIINQKLREYCLRLRELIRHGKKGSDLETEIEQMLGEVFRVCAVCLGLPPERFDWEYYDRNKKYVRVRSVTPYEFYHDQIKPIFNLEDKVCLVHDPRPEHPYNRLYTVDYLCNMVNGKPVLYINQPIDVLKKVTADSIKHNEAVWFGCDVGKHFDKKKGLLDLELHDYELLFGFSMTNLNKAQRLSSHSSMMTHAMTFTGMQVQEEDEDFNSEDTDICYDKISRWRIENSWGEENGDKGYVLMTDDWFSQYTFEVVVDRKRVSNEIVAVLKQEPIKLPAWDPMGALACIDCTPETIL